MNHFSVDNEHYWDFFLLLLKAEKALGLGEQRQFG